MPCAIALGSNLGDSRRILESALRQLSECSGITLITSSSLYQTAPVGPPQPDYLNACAVLSTSLAPRDLLHTLLSIEQALGRVRRERWGPRSLDIDLLFYGDHVLTEPDLQIPHPRLRERAFVLVPLAEIAPDWRDPVTGLSIQALCQAVGSEGVHRL
ncbi:MAG: 2-amino-4-hydroxy-6-hydroxymethyldihydropteridine diphosphokinase [Leptolyngbyaceae cyanobacterium SM2_5_2]|nr:2-amino-4-hydroxy-6-hydroxymethyldihydropteridine diphosphokinase [Leptolyngbyaceae cyanobacterium SM2_5_2]